MTKFRRHDRVRIEFEGEVINLVGHDEIDVAVTKEWTRTFKTKYATLLERPESTDERIARIERENAEMKARLAELEGDEKKKRYTIVVDPREGPYRWGQPINWRDMYVEALEDKKPTILIDKITRWFAKR